MHNVQTCWTYFKTLLQDFYNKSDHSEMLCIKGLITNLTMYLPAGAT